MDVALFSFQNGYSLLHRIRTGWKILFLISFCIFTFWGGTVFTYEQAVSRQVLIHSSTSFLLAVLVFFSGAKKISILSRMKPIFFLIFLMLTIGGLDYNLHKGDFYYDKDGFSGAVVWCFRFFISSFVSVCIFETTSPLSIKETLEYFENFIAKIIPPFKKLSFSLVVSLTINFIPQFFSTWNKTDLAVNARTNKKKFVFFEIPVLVKQFKAFFSISINQAETTRKAMLNRSR